MYLSHASSLLMGVVELIGFSASALVVISLTSASMYRLRIIGVVGALTFITYGVLSTAWPIVATNCATLTLHVVHLRRMAIERRHERSDVSAVSTFPLVAAEA